MSKIRAQPPGQGFAIQVNPLVPISEAARARIRKFTRDCKKKAAQGNGMSQRMVACDAKTLQQTTPRPQAPDEEEKAEDAYEFNDAAYESEESEESPQARGAQGRKRASLSSDDSDHSARFTDSAARPARIAIPGDHSWPTYSMRHLSPKTRRVGSSPAEEHDLVKSLTTLSNRLTDVLEGANNPQLLASVLHALQSPSRATILSQSTSQGSGRPFSTPRGSDCGTAETPSQGSNKSAEYTFHQVAGFPVQVTATREWNRWLAGDACLTEPMLMFFCLGSVSSVPATELEVKMTFPEIVAAARGELDDSVAIELMSKSRVTCLPVYATDHWALVVVIRKEHSVKVCHFDSGAMGIGKGAADIIVDYFGKYFSGLTVNEPPATPPLRSSPTEEESTPKTRRSKRLTRETDPKPTQMPTQSHPTRSDAFELICDPDTKDAGDCSAQVISVVRSIAMVIESTAAEGSLEDADVAISEHVFTCVIPRSRFVNEFKNIAYAGISEQTYWMVREDKQRWPCRAVPPHTAREFNDSGRSHNKNKHTTSVVRIGDYKGIEWVPSHLLTPFLDIPLFENGTNVENPGPELIAACSEAGRMLGL